MRPDVNTRLANFVVIGAPKCGTTSLHRYLSEHPDIYLPIQKELHFFSRPFIKQLTAGPKDRDVLADIPRTFEEYAVHYADVRDETAIGEISPSYLYFADVARAINQRLGEVKIIVILRDPIQKAYSQYLHLVRDNRETLSFYDALLAEGGRHVAGWSAIWRYAESSLYTERLRTYRDVFGDENVKVLIFEEFIADTRGSLTELLEFLSVRDDVPLTTTTVHHRSGKPRSKLLSSLLSKRSPLSRVAKAFLPRALTDSMQRRLWSLNTLRKEAIDARSMSYLQEYFRGDVAELESLLGRSLPWFRGGQPYVSHD
jgi:hypothetical protein